jgi:hypothetical protein
MVIFLSIVKLIALKNEAKDTVTSNIYNELLEEIHKK